jgi:hypothetical protein
MFLDPRIRAEFHARDSYRSLVIQAHKYGVAKGWLTRAYGWSILRPSHLLPTAWVSLNLVLLVGALFCPYSLLAWLAAIGAYCLAATVAAAGVCRHLGHPWGLVPRVVLAFGLMHGLYGVGLVRGLLVGRGRGARARPVADPASP